MRSRVISLLFLTLLVCLLGGAAASAQTIHLKNGRTIRADNVREENGRVIYEQGDNSFSIPRSIVDKIDNAEVPGAALFAGGGATDSEKTAAAAEVTAPDLEVRGAADLRARLIRNGHIDANFLLDFEKTAGNDVLAAAAYDVAGLFEQEHGSLDQAGEYFRHGLTLAPDQPALIAHYGTLLLQSNRYREGLTQAERAAKLAPNSADVLALLGFAYFLNDRSRDAIAPWKRSLEIRPNDRVRQYLARAQRELAAEASFGQQESVHFTLRYEGKETAPELRRALIAVLDSAFNDMVRELGVEPRENIPVILYSEQAFTNVTQAPAWADAVNDGKLRIPLQNVTAVTPNLARVLRHELAHSFIRQVTHGRCPTWLNEGVAQVLEPGKLGNMGRLLAQMFDAQREVPLNLLEGSFARLDDDQAAVAYSEALAVAEYINATHGMSELRRILERIGEGAGAEAAIRATLHSGYADLARDTGAYLKKTYGL